MHYFENIDNVNVIERIYPGLGDIDPENTVQCPSSNTESMFIDLVLDHYTECLINNEKALEYLASRGIDNLDMIREFRIGFSDRTLGLRLNELDKKQEESIRGMLKLSGLLKPSTHEFFHGSIVFPFIDESGCVLGGYGRRITPKLKSSSVYHVHWNPSHAMFFNQKTLLLNKIIILCKTPIEALSYWLLGFRNVVSTLGLRHFNEHHLFLLQQYEIKEVLIAFDNDRDGNRAARQVSQVLSAYDIHCRKIRYPKEKDANDCLMFSRNSKDYFSELVDKAGLCKQSFSALREEISGGE